MGGLGNEWKDPGGMWGPGEGPGKEWGDLGRHEGIPGRDLGRDVGIQAGVGGPGEGCGDPGMAAGPWYAPIPPAHSLRTVTVTGVLRFCTLADSVRTSQE